MATEAWNIQCLPSCISLVLLILLHFAVLLLWPFVSSCRCCLSVWSCVCLVQFSLQFLPVYLFVDEGAQDQVGPLHRFPSHEPATSGKRRRLLAPSISVSVPDDDPSNSDEEYYEHPLFSSQWTTSSVLPSAPAQSAEAHLGQEKGEPSMVPFCPSSQPAALTPCIVLSVPSYVWWEGQEPVFSTWKWSPYITYIYLNASTIFIKEALLDACENFLFLNCYFWKGSQKKEVEREDPKKVELKYDSFLLPAKKSIREEYILISKQKKMTLNIIFLPSYIYITRTRHK